MRLPAATHAYTLLWEVLSAHKGARRESLGAGKALAQLEAHFSHAGAPSGSGGGGGGSGGANGAKRRRPACTVLIADEIDYLVTPNQARIAADASRGPWLRRSAVRARAADRAAPRRAARLARPAALCALRSAGPAIQPLRMELEGTRAACARRDLKYR